MTRLLRFVVGFSFLALVACQGVPGEGEERMDLAQLRDELAAADVVFFAEEHDNLLAHAQRFWLFRLLHAKRPDMIVSMEMFERDVQVVLTQYLVGEISEAQFLESARPWPEYAQRYRPFVEYAKRHGIPVLAANAPRSLVRKMREEGWDAIQGNPYVARSTSAPKDAYWEAFKGAMTHHEGADEERIYAFYRSQCLWDDTMAETMADALRAARAEGRQPLVVHLVGKFHAENDGGTKTKLLARIPELDVRVVTMESAPNVMREADGDYRLVLPPRPRRAMPPGHGRRPRMPVPEGAEALPGSRPGSGPASRPAGRSGTKPSTRPGS